MLCKWRPRYSTVTRCYPNTQIFARFPTKSNITLDDAEQAHMICRNVPEEIKDECYLTFGVDRKKTEKYLQTVQQLETAYNRKNVLEIISDIFESIKYHIILVITVIRMTLV
jgi:hypothetical protein